MLDWVESLDTCIAGVVVGILVGTGAAVPLLVDKGDTLAWELVAVDGGNSPFAAFGGLLIEPGVFGGLVAAFVASVIDSAVATSGLVAIGFAMVFPLFVEAPCSFLI